MNWNKVSPKNLSGDAIESSPVNVVDWGAVFGEGDSGEGNEAFEAQRCEKCSKVYSGLIGQELTCEACGLGIGALEGPMMNYFYPVDWRDGYEAAEALVDLPLCAVEVDGVKGIALTGGGMDLSWEICAAFIALGYLPPSHYASGLPLMAMNLGPKERAVIRCCRATLQVAVKRARNGLAGLKRVTDYYAKRAAGDGR